MKYKVNKTVITQDTREMFYTTISEHEKMKDAIASYMTYREKHYDNKFKKVFTSSNNLEVAYINITPEEYNCGKTFTRQYVLDISEEHK